MFKFIFQNNYLELNGENKQQISCTAVGNKFAPLYACCLGKLMRAWIN